MISFNNFENKYVINGKDYKERKKQFYSMCKENGIEGVKRFNATIKKNNPKLGCLTSHLKLIKKAKKENMKSVLIFEDDCILKGKFNVESLPEDWDMLYIGGNVQSLNEEYDYNKSWLRANILANHCYIVNNSMYDTLINMYENNSDIEVDVILKDYIHPIYNCYILNPMIAHQRPAYSIIEKKYVNYYLKDGEYYYDIKDAEHEIKEDNYILKGGNIKDEDLPKVSILTPTYNRRKFFIMVVDCFMNFIYPRNKLEWVILDDGEEDISDLLPKELVMNGTIKYIKENKRLNISQKRNKLVELASNDILLNMDDDDYYPEQSIISRVKTLLYNKVDLVGAGVLCCYDVVIDKYYVIGANNNLGEATYCFRRSFWEERKFDESVKMGEGKLFLEGRKNRAVKIPYYYIMMVINHKKNTTQNERRNFDHDKIEESNLNELLPNYITSFLKEIVN
jgi:GR25 family glycosyltransferase involved in LPS biosynthesis